MTTDKESSVSLRIASKSITCAEISKILNWQPSKQFEKGEPWGGKKNPPHIREESLWIYDLSLDEKIPFEEQIQRLMNMILEKKEKFQEVLNKCQLEVFCGYTTHNGQGGFALGAQLMKQLALLNIDFVVEFYAV